MNNTIKSLVINKGSIPPKERNIIPSVGTFEDILNGEVLVIQFTIPEIQTKVKTIFKKKDIVINQLKKGILGIPYKSKFIVTGSDSENNFSSLTDDQVHFLKNYFHEI